MKAPYLAVTMLLLGMCPPGIRAQSADWQNVVWRDPQVRYLLADLTGGGKVDLYRKYAVEEKDPDSTEALRLWDAGVRAVNMGEFERRWVTNKLAKDGRAFRVVFRATSRTITGNEVLLTSDRNIDQAAMRLILLELCLGRNPSDFARLRPGAHGNLKVPSQPAIPPVRNRGVEDPTVAEALRRWLAGVRVVNTNWFEWGNRKDVGPNFRGTNLPADGTHVRLNSDVPYPEVNVRYFMADVALGGSLEFYRRVAEEAHEMGCLEAVRRMDEGYTITNLDQFERKKVDGKVLVTRKGSNERISGSLVKLSTDLP